MRYFRELAERLSDRMRVSLVDNEKRMHILFIWTDFIMGCVALFMTIVNIFTGKYLLMTSTALFTAACLINLLIVRGNSKYHVIARNLFMVQALILCTFFCVSGTPEGFSALWFCFIPSFAMALLGKKRGSIYSIIAFVIVAFLFWTPIGRSVLRYDYTGSFMLRFPMLLIAFFVLGLVLEAIRELTHRELSEAEQKYAYLYRRDALTGLYNRYGFDEQIDEVFASDHSGELALIMIDVDDFKEVNDTYGHDKGDVALTFVADVLSEEAGGYGKVCRWGGEEFAVLVTGECDAAELAERARIRIANAAVDADHTGREKIHVSISVGVGRVHSKEAVTIAQFVTGTDRCLYAAKESGKNRVHAEWLDEE